MCDPGDIHPVELWIRITKVPAGEAPEWVREQWVGLELRAGILPSDGNKKSGAVLGYLVSIKHALDVLGNKSVKAALWFQDNLKTKRGAFEKTNLRNFFCYLVKIIPLRANQVGRKQIKKKEKIKQKIKKWEKLKKGNLKKEKGK